MNISIQTDANLDPATPNGNKNLQLLLSSAGIRSQVDFLGINKIGKKWTVDLFLERPEFWGEKLNFLREDLDNLVLTNNKKPQGFVGHYKIIYEVINKQSDDQSEKAL